MYPKQGYNSKNKELLGHRHLRAIGKTFVTIFHGLRSRKLSLSQEILPHLNTPDPCLLATFSIAVSVFI